MKTIKYYNKFIDNKLIKEEYQTKGQEEEEEEFKVIVILGEWAVQSYQDGESFDKITNNGSINKREFNTESEARAYKLGLQDMEGNSEYLVISNEDLMRIQDKEGTTHEGEDIDEDEDTRLSYNEK